MEHNKGHVQITPAATYIASYLLTFPGYLTRFKIGIVMFQVLSTSSSRIIIIIKSNKGHVQNTPAATYIAWYIGI